MVAIISSSSKDSSIIATIFATTAGTGFSKGHVEAAGHRREIAEEVVVLVEDEDKPPFYMYQRIGISSYDQ